MKTTGQQFTQTIRHNLSIGSQTRRFRNHEDVVERVLEQVEHAAYQPGWFSQQTEDALHPAAAAVASYRKHIQGYRLVVASEFATITPWQLTALLGQMVDAGVTNVGEGERFFKQMGKVAA